MVYLIVGTIVCLSGVGLLMNGLDLPGIILLLVGAAFGMKGRWKIDKNK